MSEMDQFILEWIADYCTGRINAEEAGKLREWIDKASENRELFEQYLKTVKINRMVEGKCLMVFGIIMLIKEVDRQQMNRT